MLEGAFKWKRRPENRANRESMIVEFPQLPVVAAALVTVVFDRGGLRSIFFCPSLAWTVFVGGSEPQLA